MAIRPGDLLTVNDHSLFQLLQEHAQLVERVCAVDCWLSRRMRRAGISHGVVVSLSLLAQQQGLAVIELQADAPLFALDSLISVLITSLDCVSSATAPGRAFSS